jgi:DNA gyrase/topoisomerase IV subunit A
METITAMSSRSLQYYVVARRWVSDLEFFKIETQFLERLLDDHFTQLCSEDHIDKLRAVSKKLSVLEEDEQQADKLLSRQLKHLELMAEDALPEDADSLAATQVQLEYLVTNLTREYRGIKKELFQLVTQVIHKHRIYNQ